MPPQRLATPLASPSTLRLAERRAARIGRFDVHGEGEPGRREVEAFVQAIYREHYGAAIRHWAPTLVGLWQRGTLVAAAGYRRATDALFLERYLAAPVDESIGAKTGIAATRESICEVGHFASARAGAG